MTLFVPGSAEGGTTRALVTGCAGFIGSRLSVALAKKGYLVVGVDNLRSGSLSNISELEMTQDGFRFIRGDCKSSQDMTDAIHGIDVIFHLAASSEVRPDRSDPDILFQENIVATKTLLEAIRVDDRRSVKRLFFTSSSTVYGDALSTPTPEIYSPLFPISIYGASKLACEALISAYAKSSGFDASILRLANIVGPGTNHGVVHDFLAKLTANPERLEILGDGMQRKSYLHIDDCISGILAVAEKPFDGVCVYNIGSTEFKIDVGSIARIVSSAMNLEPSFRFTGGVDGGRGWTGDVKNMLLDTSKLRSTGWRPLLDSSDAISTTLRQMGLEKN